MVQSALVSRRFLLGVVGAVAAGSALAACGGSAPTASTTAPSAPTSASAAPMTAPAPATAAPASATTPTSAAAASAPTPTPQPAAQAAPSSAGKVTVSFWHGNSGVLGDELKKMGDKFNAANSKVSVDPIFSGDYNALRQKLLAAIQAGTPPDAAQAGSNSDIASYLAAGALTPIANFVNGPDGLSKDSLDDIYSGFLDDNTFAVKGVPTVVSWPFNKSDEVLYYNRDLLNSLKVEQPPATWDEFVADAKTVTGGGKAKGLAWTPSSDLFTAILYSYGGQPYDPSTKKVAFQSDAGVKALGLLTGMFVTDKTAYVTKSYDWQSDFEHGKSAMALSTIVSRAYIEKDLQGQSGSFYVGIAALPKGNQPSTVLFGSNAVILSKAPSDHQQGAWDFLKWYAEPDQTAQWSLTSGYMPLRKSALNTDLMKKAIADDPRRAVAIKELDYAHPWQPNLSPWTEIDGYLTDAITAALLGKSSPADALKSAAQKGDAALAAG